MKKHRVTYNNLKDLATSYGLDFCQSAPIRCGSGRYFFQYTAEMNYDLNKWIKKNYTVKITKGKYDMWNYYFSYDVINVNSDGDGRRNYVYDEDRTLRYTKTEQHYKKRFPNLAKVGKIDLTDQEITHLTDLTWEEWEDRFARMVFANGTDDPKKHLNPIVKAKDYHNKAGQFKKPFFSALPRRK